jgi:hypothetical protein
LTIILQPKTIIVSYPNKTIILTIILDHHFAAHKHHFAAGLEEARARAAFYSIILAVSPTGHHFGPSFYLV